MEDLSLYLKPTYYIDYDSPRISLICKELATEDPRQQARAIFNFARDRIIYNPYSFFYLPEHYSASRTLERGEGFCVQKAVLLTALARAFNIPSRLVFADIRNHLMPPKLWNMMRTNIFVFHGYNELYIEGRWIKATPTFNIGMCRRLNIRPVEFDGRNPAVFHSHDLKGNLHVEYITSHGHFADLPFEKMLDAFTKAYSEDVIERWKDSGLEATKAGEA